MLLNENNLKTRQLNMIQKIKQHTKKDNSFLKKIPKNVLNALEKVPRHIFVPKHMIEHAYNDSPLSIGENQTISQPYIVALMTSLLTLDQQSTVLEIGTGCGYQTAILATIVKKVYSIEIIKKLHLKATDTLSKIGYSNIKTSHNDGYFGWDTYAPYDAITVSSAYTYIPPKLIEQLNINGKLIMPIENKNGNQQLILITKTSTTSINTKILINVRFVPFTRF